MQILSRTKSSLKAENPKVITNLIYLPKKKLFQFSAIVKSGPNAMTAIGDYLSEMVTVLYGEITAIPGQEYSSISYFVEGKKPGITKDSIKAMLASSPMIVSCQVAEGKDGLILDTQKFPLRLSTGHRALLLSDDAFRSMLSQIRTVFSSGGALIIYQEGLASGKKNGTNLLQVFGYPTIMNYMDELIYLYAILGIGRPEIVEMNFEQRKATIRLYDNFECQDVKSDKPFSEYVRGHLCGVSSVFFNSETKCAETKCAAVGDNFCEFELRQA